MPYFCFEVATNASMLLSMPPFLATDHAPSQVKGGHCPHSKCPTSRVLWLNCHRMSCNSTQWHFDFRVYDMTHFHIFSPCIFKFCTVIISRIREHQKYIWRLLLLLTTALGKHSNITEKIKPLAHTKVKANAH